LLPYDLHQRVLHNAQGQKGNDMDDDDGYPDGRVPLRELGDPGPRVRARRDSIRKVRRMSNWTAAALIVGTGAAAEALAHQTFPAAAPAAGAAGQAGGAATSGGRTGASPQATGGPQVTHSVATTTASGVTVTTTTRTINGKTVVTQVRSAPAHRDD
jgi:hypothetical protein